MSERELFIAALQHNDPAERAAYLAKACGANVNRRARIERLLRLHEDAGEFLERSALDPRGTADVSPFLADDNEHPPPTSGPESPEVDEEALGLEMPDKRIGAYKLLQQIGQGGMGTVWMAEQQEPVRRLVALKVIRAGMDDRRVAARFEAERQALALMDHPNIARVLDAGTTEHGRLFFVMDLVKGIPIVEYCDQQRLTPRDRLELFMQVCRAIQHAHQKGIIHRDIKPSNVLVAPYDGRPVVKVIDFGVAKAISQRLTERTLYTEFGAVVGTLEYMSPEQAELNNQDIDTRSDVYSLGVLLYELLTGTTPLTKERLEGATFTELLRVIREEEPPRPSARLSTSKTTLATISAQRQTEPAQLPRLMRGELDWIVMKALEKDRSRRYETANSLARDVERYLHDEPVEACPPSARYQLQKLARRYRGPLLVAAGVGSLLIVGVAITSWLAVRAEAAEAREKAEAGKARRSAAEAHAVLNFFQDQVLAAARPEGQDGGLGTDVTIRKAVDVAEPKIAVAFENEPVIEASVRRALGETYRHLGEQRSAIPQLERARDLQIAELGPDHPDTLSTENELANAYWGAGRLRDAIPLLERVATASRNRLGPADTRTLSARNDLGFAYMEDGQLDRAIPLIEQTLAAREAVLGSDHPDTLLSRSTLGLAYQAVGRLDRAIALFEQTLTDRAAKLGPEHPDTLRSQNYLAVAYLADNQVDRAVRLLEKTLASRTARLGHDHPETMITQNNLARALDEAGAGEQAEKVYRDVLELRRKKRGNEHPHVAITLDDLGWYLVRHRRYADAEPLLRECLAIREKMLPDDWNRFNAESRLGESLLAQGKPAEAEPLLLQGYEGMKARETRMPAGSKARLAEAAERLADLYDKQGKKDAADAWRKKVTEFKLPRRRLVTGRGLRIHAGCASES
jgi:eukaryotic-like serine/threonine-protein kinase